MYANEHVRQFFRRISLLWAFARRSNAYDHDLVAVDAVARDLRIGRVAVSWSVMITTIIVSTLWFRHSMAAQRDPRLACLRGGDRPYSERRADADADDFGRSRARRAPPADRGRPPRAAVVVVHGFTASADCPHVEALAEALHGDELDVVTYDARGHGAFGRRVDARGPRATRRRGRRRARRARAPIASCSSARRWARSPRCATP